MAVALDLHVLARGHGARLGDAAEVVPPEVDEHHVLGAFLGVVAELVGEPVVVRRRRAARAGAGDRVGRHPVARHLDEELRAGADDLHPGRPGEEQVRAGVDPPERAVEADAVDRRAVGDGRQVEALAPGEHDLDRLAGRDRVLGPLDRADVLVAAEARLDLAQARSVGGAVVRGGAPERRRHLGLARAGGPLERLEDRPLGDPVAAVEVRRLRVERRDRAQLVAEVVEHDHEVRLDEARQRGAHRVAVGQRHGRLERRDRVVAEGADRAAGEPRHPVDRARRDASG